MTAIRVVKGEPSAEEVAALVLALLNAGRRAEAGPVSRAATWQAPDWPAPSWRLRGKG
jgi:hypothetical protein